MNTCPIKGCRVELRPGLVMCGGHWKLLPAKIRADFLRDARDPALQTKAINRVIASVRARIALQDGRPRWERGEPLRMKGAK